ncbi:serine hydrolase domain-containing protein [Sphingomonas flavalba]|uniref:serine hydrolase domain-containing protein n=1 Tax=Sphingomonas flavalba TaxID=2559804 RepID=UPI0039DF3DFD
MKTSVAWLAVLLAGTAPVAPALSAPQAPSAAAAPVGDEDALFELRRRFIDNAFTALTFQTMNKIFQSQTVAAGDGATPLPRAEHPLDFTYAFDGQTRTTDGAMARTFTSALLVMKDGKIVFERYRNLSDEQTRFLSMSASKSITSILIGIAIDRGAIRSVNDLLTAYVPELKGSAYDGVTIRQALDMKTGVDRNDGAQLKPGTPDAARREEMLVRNARPLVDEALMVARKAPPGGAFEYTTLNVTVLGWVLERATGETITAFTEKYLWKPLGAEASAYWITDGPGAKGRPMNGMGFNATLRDYARIGQMMLDGGRANGRQIVSERWVAESTGGPHPAFSPGGQRGYQYLWWTVAGTPAYMADGMGGQYIYVDPTTRTVIVKLSHVPIGNGKAFAEGMALMQAAAKWQPGAAAGE